MRFIDTNVWCGSWPFAPLSQNTSPRTGRRSLDIDITEVLVSHFDCVFQTDPMPGNRSAFKAFEKLKAFRPLPVLNPATPAWEDHLEKVAAIPGVAGVRLLPAYHGFRLNSAPIRNLVQRIKEKKLRLVITARLVDERHEHPAVKVKPVNVAHLADFIQRYPKANPLIQGLGIHELKKLSQTDGLFSTDTSFAEWENTLKTLKAYVPVSRIFFGSLSPLQVTLAQIDKVRLSSLTPRQRASVASGNARNYFGI